MKTITRNNVIGWIFAPICLASATVMPVGGTTLLSGDRILIGSHSYHPNGDYLPWGSAAIGHNNQVFTPYSLAVGYYNVIDTSDNENSSLAVGQFNTLVGYFSIVCGSYNMVADSCSITAGYYNSNNASNSLVVGTGNIAEFDPHKNGLVVGKYNKVEYNNPAYLVVGNGSNTSNRSNSFVIYANGDVVITKAQGDISMGIYGN